MGSLLTELGYNEIISADIAANLRKYIALRNPGMSAAGRAGIFADALNRIVDSRLPPFNAELVKKLKALLFKDITGKTAFSVNCSDVFKAAVKLKMTNPEFLSQLSDWISDVLKKAVVRENLSDLVVHAHGLMDSMPGDDISHMIALADQSTGGLEYSGDSQAAGKDTGVAFVEALREEAGVCQAKGDEGTGPLSPGCNIRSQDTAPEKVIDKITKEEHSLRDGSHQEAGLPDRTSPGENIPSGIGFCKCSPLQPTFPEKAGVIFSVLLRCLSVPDPKKVLVASALAAFIIFSAVLTSDTTAAAPVQSNPASPVFPQVSMVSYPLPRLHDDTSTRDLRLAASLNDDTSSTRDPSIEQMSSRRMKATAYDLSVESCGKKPDHPQYGITSSGTKATVGRTIAVDPEVIPLGSRVHISFPPEYSSLDGIYIAEDTGRLIKGNKIDIFFGEDEQGNRRIYESAKKFGIRYVDVRMLD